MIELQSSSPSLLTPTAITVHPRQSAASFRIEAASHSEDSSATITARIDDDTVNQTVNIDPATPSLTLPSHVYGRPARSLGFRVASAIPGAVLSASDLPPGAVFDAGSGDFEWTPGVSQQGAHRVAFTATGRSGDPVTAQSLVEIESGSPIISRLVNAATRSEDAVCSPGAIGRIEGRWLLEDSSMPAGLGNGVLRETTVVKVNGSEAPLLSSSPSHVDFLCPAAAPGVSLEIALQTSIADAPPFRTVARAFAPGIFSVNESSQGAIVHAGTDILAMIPDHLHASQPALAGDELSIYAMGIEGAPLLIVRIGEIEVTPTSIGPLPEQPGAYRINVILPDGLSTPEVPVFLKIPMPDGSTVESNKVTLASERQTRSRQTYDISRP
jgi:uncharacterized protein (TIGR03437 family)